VRSAIFPDFTDSPGSIGGLEGFGPQVFDDLPALAQRHRVGADLPDVCHAGTGETDQLVMDRGKIFPHNVKPGFRQQVVNIANPASEGVFQSQSWPVGLCRRARLKTHLQRSGRAGVHIAGTCPMQPHGCWPRSLLEMQRYGRPSCLSLHGGPAGPRRFKMFWRIHALGENPDNACHNTHARLQRPQLFQLLAGFKWRGIKAHKALQSCPAIDIQSHMTKHRPVTPRGRCTGEVKAVGWADLSRRQPVPLWTTLGSANSSGSVVGDTSVAISASGWIFSACSASRTKAGSKVGMSPWRLITGSKSPSGSI
jgi:hypothetical protein